MKEGREGGREEEGRNGGSEGGRREGKIAPDPTLLSAPKVSCVSHSSHILSVYQ